MLPAAMPSFVGGLKQGWAFAWRSLMAGELIVILGPSVGFLLQQYRNLADAAGLIAMMIVILVVGILVDALVLRHARPHACAAVTASLKSAEPARDAARSELDLVASERLGRRCASAKPTNVGDRPRTTVVATPSERRVTIMIVSVHRSPGRAPATLSPQKFS